MRDDEITHMSDPDLIDLLRRLTEELEARLMIHAENKDEGDS